MSEGAAAMGAAAKTAVRPQARAKPALPAKPPPVPPVPAAPPVRRGRLVPLTPMRQRTAQGMRKLAAEVAESHPDMSVHQHLRDAARVLESGDEEAAQRHLRAAMFALTPQSLMRNGLHTDDLHAQARAVMHGVHRHLLLTKDIADVRQRNETRRAPDPPALAPVAQPGQQAPSPLPPAAAKPGTKAEPEPPLKPATQLGRSWDELAAMIELAGDGTGAVDLAGYTRRPGEDVQCPVCERYNQDDARFCDQCGTSLSVSKPGYTPKAYDSGSEAGGEPVTCPYCGQGDADDARFCDQCGHRLPPGAGARLAHELSAETGRLAVTPAPRGKPGGPGLYHVKGNEHSPYLQNIVKALIRRGVDPSKAYAIARSSMEKWAAKSKHPEVRAAAAGGLGQEKAAQARAHAHAAEPEHTVNLTWDDLAGMIEIELTGTAAGAALDPRAVTGRFGSGGTAAGGKPPAGKAQKKAALLKAAAADRAKAAQLGKQRSLLRSQLASASGAVSKGQKGAKSAAQAGSKTAANTPAKKAAAAKTAKAPAAKKPGSKKMSLTAAQSVAVKTQIAGLNTQINALLAAAKTAMAQAAKM